MAFGKEAHSITASTTNELIDKKKIQSFGGGPTMMTREKVSAVSRKPPKVFF